MVGITQDNRIECFIFIVIHRKFEIIRILKRSKKNPTKQEIVKRFVNKEIIN